MSTMISSALTCLLALAPVTGDTWPAFRGDGTNHTPARDLPLHWSPEKNIAWTADLQGYGQSSPVVWKDRLFVTSVEGDEKETCIVSAYALAGGALLWQHAFPAAQRIENTSFVMH